MRVVSLRQFRRSCSTAKRPVLNRDLQSPDSWPGTRTRWTAPPRHEDAGIHTARTGHDREDHVCGCDGVHMRDSAGASREAVRRHSRGRSGGSAYLEGSKRGSASEAPASHGRDAAGTRACPRHLDRAPALTKRNACTRERGRRIGRVVQVASSTQACRVERNATVMASSHFCDGNCYRSWLPVSVTGLGYRSQR